MFRKLNKVTTVLLIVGLLVLPSLRMKSYAAEFEEAYVRFDRMKIGESDPGVLVVVRPQTIDTETGIQISLPPAFTVDAACTVTTDNLPDGVSVLPGTLSCSGSGQTISITGVTDLTVSTAYGVNIATGVDLPDSAGAYTINVKTLTSVPQIIDESDVVIRVMTNDQIVLTGTTPPTFNFTLSANSDTFTGDLDVSAVVSTSGINTTLVTNARNGWVAFIRSANQALASAVTGDSIPTVGTVNDNNTTSLVIGTKGYVADIDLNTDSASPGSGTVTIDLDYDHSGTDGGGTLTSSHQLIASSDGPTDTDIITIIARATISAFTKTSDDYSDTLIVVGAGNF